MHLDIVHSNRECLHESGDPHILHALELAMCRCARTSLVGIDCFDSLYRNILIFPGTLIFHSFFHSPSSLAELEEPARFSSHASRRCRVLTSIRYADFTEKIPFFSWAQPQKSSTLRVHVGIFVIALASIGMKIDLTKASFHDAVAGDRSSATSLGGFGTRDVIGLGTVSLGIQLSSQM